MSYNTETGMYEGFIYKISSDKTKNEYIGKTTKKSIYSRWSDHKSACKTNAYDYALYRGMRKYGIDSFNIELIEKIESNTKENLETILNEKEIYYIEKYNTYFDGYNETLGGDGNSGHGDKVVAYDRNGKLLIEADSINEMAEIVGCNPGVISRSCKGETVPRINMIFRYYNHPIDEYRMHRINGFSRPLYCFDKSGNLLRVFNTLTEASEELNIKYVRLQKASLYHRFVDNYYFSYENKFNPVKNSKHCIPTDLYDFSTNEYIGSFDSINDALIFIGKDPKKCGHGGIIKCMRGEAKQSFGYVWKINPNVDYSDIYAHTVKPINVYFKNGDFYMTFYNQSIAAKELSIHHSLINDCLCGRQKSSHGYCFYYANDPNQPDPTKVTDITAKELFNQQAA